jgi:hypothetical protein
VIFLDYTIFFNLVFILLLVGMNSIQSKTMAESILR